MKKIFNKQTIAHFALALSVTTCLLGAVSFYSVTPKYNYTGGTADSDAPIEGDVIPYSFSPIDASFSQ